MKKSLLCVVGLLTLGATVAAADELPNRPSAFILGTTSFLPWTGFYLGVNGGYGWADSSVNYSPNDAASVAGTGGVAADKGTALPSTDFLLLGGTAGGQVGYDWQINPLWLAGVAADFQWADFASGGSVAFRLGNVGATNAVTTQAVDSFGTVRVRLGVLPVNSLLVYGTAGLAFGRLSENMTIQNPLTTGTGSVSSGGFSYSCTAGGPACFAGTSSSTQFGWSGGLGTEFRITNNISFLSELLYLDLAAPKGTAVAQAALAGTTPSSVTASFPQPKIIILRGGFNYRF